MCYSIPGRVVSLKNKIAVLDYFGERRQAKNELLNLHPGDYAYAQGGISIQKIAKKEANPILKEWKKIFFQLKKRDLELAEVKRGGRLNKEFKKIIAKGKQGLALKKAEILRLLKTSKKEELDLLFKTANQLRHKKLKNSCCVHGIIEFSNYCRNNCAYCGIRNGNRELKRYRLKVDEIVELAITAINELGFKALVLQSGEDDWYTTEKLVQIIKKIKAKAGVLLFMSVGERSLDCYQKLYRAGARGVLLRFETSNPKLYRKIHLGPKSDFQSRIKLLKALRKMGYLIVTGSLIGLPGQTNEDLANDILLTKSLGAEMYSFGPLIPHPRTPLAKTKKVSLKAVLKVLAVSRLVDPNGKILVTSALETLDKKNGRRQGLLAGANSLMINLTPAKYKKLYAIYLGQADRNKEVKKNIEETLKLLYSLGRAPTDLGN